MIESALFGVNLKEGFVCKMTFREMNMAVFFIYDNLPNIILITFRKVSHFEIP